jgi:hypothetical protein
MEQRHIGAAETNTGSVFFYTGRNFRRQIPQSRKDSEENSPDDRLYEVRIIDIDDNS